MVGCSVVLWCLVFELEGSRKKVSKEVASVAVVAQLWLLGVLSLSRGRCCGLLLLLGCSRRCEGVRQVRPYKGFGRGWLECCPPSTVFAAALCSLGNASLGPTLSRVPAAEVALSAVRGSGVGECCAVGLGGGAHSSPKSTFLNPEKSDLRAEL